MGALADFRDVGRHFLGGGGCLDRFLTHQSRRAGHLAEHVLDEAGGFAGLLRGRHELLDRGADAVVETADARLQRFGGFIQRGRTALSLRRADLVTDGDGRRGIESQHTLHEEDFGGEVPRMEQSAQPEPLSQLLHQREGDRDARLGADARLKLEATQGFGRCDIAVVERSFKQQTKMALFEIAKLLAKGADGLRKVRLDRHRAREIRLDDGIDQTVYSFCIPGQAGALALSISD
ncbi:hypothetical protein [Bosea sp. AAP35]|uniref:hypothetical protein n=1 Tax=Bosea sp. AAP35 TaxID=1523417 RepID=UPI0020BEC5EC|nr:hypothetical protein [Bosea sp. AAP35]